MENQNTPLEILTKVSQQELSVEEAVRLLGQTNTVPAKTESRDGTPQTESFNEALNGAESASISLSTAEYPVEISSLKDSTNLLEARLQHRGKVSWQVEGDTHRRIIQTYKEKRPFHFFSTPNMRWHYGLSTLVPLTLDVDSGSGSMHMNLAELQLTGLSIDSGSGSVRLALPKSTEQYNVKIDSGSGSIKIDIADQANLKLEIDSGSGSIQIRMAKDSEYRVTLEEHGSGSFNLPSKAVRIAGTRKEGVWQTAGYEKAAKRTEIVVSQGSGSFSLHCSQD